jgi:hypothetical protein
MHVSEDGDSQFFTTWGKGRLQPKKTDSEKNDMIVEFFDVLE